jgi:hypothetical protein
VERRYCVHVKLYEGEKIKRETLIEKEKTEGNKKGKRERTNE